MDVLIGLVLVFVAGVVVGVVFYATLSAVYGKVKQDVADVKADALSFSARIKALEDGVKKAL